MKTVKMRLTHGYHYYKSVSMCAWRGHIDNLLSMLISGVSAASGQPNGQSNQ